jgi:hypothetical protein
MITASAFQPLHPRWGIDVQSFDRIAIKKADAVAEMAAFDKLARKRARPCVIRRST